MSAPNDTASLGIARLLVVIGICGITATALRLLGGSGMQVAVVTTGTLVLSLILLRLEARAVLRALERGRLEAQVDPVTELASPEYADHFIASEYAAAIRGRRVTLVLFGFDGLEQYAVAHGPDGVDAAVHEFGRVLKQLTRKMNLSARYGWRADAFLSVVSDSGVDGARVFVQRVQEAFAGDGTRIMPEVSAGVVEFSAAIGSPAEFVIKAEQALAAARAAGRGSVYVVGPTAETQRRAPAQLQAG